MQIIDLSGSWNYRTDEKDNGIQEQYYNQEFVSSPFLLPGSTCDNHIGTPAQYHEEFNPQTVRAPRERYEYVGPLWLQKKIAIPQSFQDQTICLFLERVNMASRLWIDGIQIDRQVISFGTPHIYDLTRHLTPGKHTITLQLDNRNLLNLDTMSSGYSTDTQGFWNGILGKIQLICEPPFHLENIQVYPDDSGILVKTVQTCDIYSPLERGQAAIELTATGPDGKSYPMRSFSCELFTSRQVNYFRYDMEDFIPWNEFHPALYTLTVKYTYKDSTDEKQVTFGMRTIQSQGNQLMLNHTPLSLRGTVNCAIYPLTGYPPTDYETWKKHFGILQSYGLNHVRFHTWCPPENAFLAADRLGMYLSVEMPLWLNKDVCTLECGDDPIHRSFFHQEAEAISRTYGNHPSFLMFANGNENMGDFSLLEDITTQIKALDNRRLYTLTSNFDHPILPCEDYLCAFEAGGHKIRIQDLHDEVGKDTSLTYEAAVNDVPVPIISFETGQYCTYPDLDIMNKYTGNMVPVNYYSIKKHMEKCGVSNRMKDYAKASGDLAVKLYKEDIEAVMRTHHMGGFQLLALTDYTGQDTATIGILDAFFESKGFISPAEFRNFCGPVVPLFKAKRIFTVGEILHAQLDLYDYGEKAIPDPTYKITLSKEDQVLFTAKTTDSQIDIPLDFISHAMEVKVTLSVEQYQNTWRIFVFPKTEKTQNPTVLNSLTQVKELLENGGTGILTPALLKESIQGSFIPVFWSPMFFPTTNPCGAIIHQEHPIFQDFPTKHYPDYQWKGLLENSRSIDFSDFPADFTPIVEMVPNYADNTPSTSLWEAKIGKARILFCGFDLSKEDPASVQLKHAVHTYVNSDAFQPKNTISEELLLSKLQC